MARLEAFVENFHNLEGVTLGQRQASFRKLLADFKNTNPDSATINALVATIVPRTKLEEALKIDFYIEFKLFEDLLDVLKTEKIYLKKKVIKEKWVFQEAFESVTVDRFINDLLLEVSFVTRQAILGCLAALFKNETLADQYYERGVEKYGSKEMMKLLPCCSTKKVLETISKYKYQLPEKYTLHLTKRDPTFFVEYIKIFPVDYWRRNHKECLRYLATYHTDQFCKLMEKEDFITSVNLNSKASKAVLQKQHDKVLESPCKYTYFFREGEMRKHYKNDFQKLFENCFPKHSSSWYFEKLMKDLLKGLSKEEMYELLFKSFEKVYGEGLLDEPSRVAREMMFLIPKDQIEAVVNKKTSSPESDWYQYLPVEKSIEILKKKINVTSNIGNRKCYITHLIETCAFNGHDLDALLKVMEYFLERHRNDDEMVRKAFLNQLKSSFRIENFSEEHWKIINEVLKVGEVKEDRYDDEMHLNYMVFLLRNNKSIKDEVIKYLENVKLDKAYLCTDKFKPNLLHEKTFLEEVMANINAVDFGKDLDKQEIVICGLLHDWNLRNPKDEFDLTGKYSKYLETLKKPRKKDLGGSTVLKEICKSWKYIEKYNLWQEFWEFLKESTCPTNTLISLLKTQPEHVLEKVDLIATVDTAYDKFNFYKILAKYEHMDMPQRYAKACKIILNSEDLTKVKELQMKSIAMFLGGKEYLEEISRFIPSETKLDCSVIDKNLLAVQKLSVKNMKLIIEDFEAAFDILIKFCEADYLEYALTTVYHFARHLREGSVVPFLEKLGDKAVSVRKHYIFTISQFYTKVTALTALLKSGQREKNPSVCKAIFKCSHKWFVDNPCEESWRLIEQNIAIIDPEDDEAYALLKKFPKSKDYIVKYFMLAWNCFEKASDDIKSKKYDLIKSLDKDGIDMLDENFCMEIIREKLFMQPYLNPDITIFMRRFVSSNSNEDTMSRKLNELFKFFKGVIDERFNEKGSMARNLMREIMCELCAEAVAEKLQVLASLLFLKLQSLAPLEELYVETLIVQFTIDYFEFLEEEENVDDLKPFARAIIKTYEKYALNNQYALLPLLEDSVKKFFQTVLKIAYHEEKFLKAFGENNNHPISLLLVLSCFSTYVSRSDPFHTVCENVLSHIESSKDPIVRLRYKHFLSEYRVV